MKKIISCLFAGVLAVASAGMAQAAPLARWSKINDATSAEHRRSETPQENRGRAMLPQGLTRTVTSPVQQLFQTPASPTLVKKGTAARSASAAQRASSNVKVFGAVIYSTTWTEAPVPYGLYSVPTSSEGSFNYLAAASSKTLYCGYDGDHTLYQAVPVTMGTWLFGVDINIIDTRTWTQVGVIEGYESLYGMDVDVDPVSGKFYGSFVNTDTEDVFWGVADFAKGAYQATKIKSMERSFRGVAIDETGQAYGIDTAGNLYKVEKETGELTLVGATGLPTLKYMSSAAYNDKDNTIIVSYCNDEGAGLYEVNPETAASTLVYNFPGEEEVLGMWIPTPIEDKAPAAAENLTVACPQGDANVEISFTAPSALYDGTPVENAAWTYTIYANGVEVATGNATSGEDVNTTATVEAKGVVNFDCYLVNAEGRSPKVSVEAYVGRGIPKAPANVVLAYVDGKLQLSWDAVTECADAGYFNADDVRYNVIDAEGNTVATGLDATTWATEQAIPAELTTYTFSVVADNAGSISKATKSNQVILGHQLPPLDVDLMKEANFKLHTVIDANADGKTWIFDSKGTYYKYGSKDADDWLVSAPIYLEEGKCYDFSAVARPYSSKYPEDLEIFMGTAPTAEAMTISLVEKTTLTDPTTLTALIVPEESGEYYIGFHAVTPGGQWNLYLSGYNVGAPLDAAAPAPVTGLTVTPDLTGELTATVTFTTAATDLTGKPYEGDMEVIISRDGTTVSTQTAAASTAITFNDTVEESGYHTYTVECRKPQGDSGKSVSATSFVGVNEPKAPASIKVVEDADVYNKVHLTWVAPTEDIDGNALYAPNLSYNVYMVVKDGDDYVWQKQNSAPIIECEFTFQAVRETAPQSFGQFAVQTVNKDVAGEEICPSGLIAIGEPYELPVRISNIDDLEDMIVGIDSSNGCTWGMTADGTLFSSIFSYDEDGQYFYGERKSSGVRTGDLVLGKFSFADIARPELSFYVMKLSDYDENELDVVVLCEGEYTTVKTVTYENDTPEMWTKKSVDLSAFSGKDVQLLLRYRSKYLVYYVLDNIVIAEKLDYDMAANKVSAPASVAADEEFEVTVEISNEGLNAAENFTVELLANGVKVDERPVALLDPEQSMSIFFNQSIGITDATKVEYSANIVFAADLNSLNDATQKNATVNRIISTLPTVKDLTGNRDEDGNLISWSAITDADIPFDQVVEGFEDAESFAKEVEGWTFLDLDNTPSGGFKDIEIPGHTPGTDAMSFMVFDYAHYNSGISKDFAAASGDKYIGSIYCIGETASDASPSDDWAISPTLDGSEQTVTFMARNLSINYQEHIQVWYSYEESVDPDDYEMLEEFNTPGADFCLLFFDKWTKLSFTLPEGSLHFAIRVISNDGFMTMLDDFAFIPEGATKSIEFVGYNLYCDGAKLNSEPITDNSFLHNISNDTDHTYHVTAVYNQGESEPVMVTVEASGLNKVSANAANVSVEGRDIVVVAEPTAKVAVYSVDGKQVYGGQGDARVPATTGIYLVTVNGRSVKVVVR